MPSRRFSFREKTMRKFFAAALIAVCLVCAGLAAACAPKYYIFNYEQIDGITYVSEVADGAEVKKGYAVEFLLEIDESKVTIKGDAPVVTANGKELTADDNGDYRVTVKSNVTVTVANAEPKCRVSFVSTVTVMDKGQIVDTIENGVFFSSDDVDVKKELIVEKGTEISFKVRPSVYCKPVRPEEGVTVLAGTTIITPDENGVYTLDVKGDVNVQARDVEMDEGFVLRKDCGDGSSANPFKISRPVDLFYMAAGINSDSLGGNVQYQTAYYRLENDIDLQGEQLYIIGDMLASQSAFFAGDFDGNGHTISNYYIKDAVIDQETYVNVFTPYMGLFGFAGATTSRTANIYNLNLEDFSINADADGEDKDFPEINGIENKSFSVGGIVGYGQGVTITGCSVGGEINVIADENFPAYAGGVIGYQMSVSDASSRFYSAVRSCSSAVNVSGQSGLAFAAGGISGYVASYEERANAFILNCFSSGKVGGALNAGGIAGVVSGYGAVGNCYSASYVSAACRLTLTTGNEQFSYAYAGKIAGYLDCDTVLYNCFGAGDKPFAYSVNGDAFSLSGDFAGYVAVGGAFYVETHDALLLNNVYASGGVYDKNFFENTLNWNEGDWDFGTDGYPLINRDGAQSYVHRYNITVDLGGRTAGGDGSLITAAEDVYIPMSYWYLRDGGVEEFTTSDDGMRTYGYYFDAELTQYVPYGYVPVNDITLYAGFADYSQIAGTYYLRLDGKNEASVLLKENGDLVYRDGALINTSYYIYNGDYAILFGCPALVAGGEYLAGKATLENGVLSVINWAGADTEGAYVSSAPLIAIKEIPGFNYGAYYAGDSVYTFYGNGTGVTGAGVKFEYTVNGNALTATNGITAELSGGKVIKVNGVSVNAIDAFEGVWEKSAGTHKQYTFDGKGNWSYEYFGYDDNGEKIILENSAASGKYTVSGDKLTFAHGGKTMTAGFDNNGFLVIGDGTYTCVYYRQNSFTGRWKHFNTSDMEAVEFTLEGIGKDGYGYATVTYGGGEYRVTYEAVSRSGGVAVNMYYNDFAFGTLYYSAADGTLSGDIFSDRYGAMYKEVLSLLRPGLANPALTFFLYDDLEGVWISDTASLALVRFNGLGSYDGKADGLHTAVRGTVTVNGITAGAYTLENSTLTGYFDLNGVTYKISYNERENTIEVVNTADLGKSELIRRDGWYGLELVDGDGDVYSFDGRGNLSSLGTLTVTDVSGAKTQYKYAVTSSGVAISGAASGSITDGADDTWTLNLNGNKALTVNNGFEGEWLIGDNDGVAKYLTVGKTGRSLTADGTAQGQAVTFTYGADGVMSFVYDGVTYYLKRVGTELMLGVERSLKKYSLCIPKVSQDAYLGVYSAADGTRLTMDGLSNAEYANGGTAVHWDADGTALHVYVYHVENGAIIFTEEQLDSDGNIIMVHYCLTRSADGKFAISGSTDKYSITAVDRFYGNYTVDGDDESVTYAFNGMGGVTSSDGKSYTYDIEKVTVSNYVYTLNLTADDGKEYVATFSSVGFDKDLQVFVYKMTVREKA